MAGHSTTLHPFIRVYFDLWHRVQSHALTRDLLFEDLRQGRRVGYVDGKAQPKEFWEHVSTAPGSSEGTTFYVGITYDGEPLYEDVHVTDVLPDPIAVRIDAPLHIRLLDMFRGRRSQGSAEETGLTSEKQAAKSWITAETKRMKAADEIPDSITKFARSLEVRMYQAPMIDPSIRPVQWTYIKNNLSKWGLWPASKIPR